MPLFALFILLALLASGCALVQAIRCVTSGSLETAQAPAALADRRRAALPFVGQERRASQRRIDIVLDLAEARRAA